MSDHPGDPADMDVLTDVLVALRLRAWLYSRTEITPPWRFDFTPSPDAVFHVIGSGGGHLLSLEPRGENASSPIPLDEGDIIVFPHGDPHTICDGPDSPLTQKVSLSYEEGRPHQIFPFGGDDGTVTVMLCGAFRLDREFLPLLPALPPMIHVPAAQGGISHEIAAVVALIDAESRTSAPGTESVLRRLSEILFIQVTRAWLQSGHQRQTGWLAALADPTIGNALGLIHRHPERPWQLGELADAMALSRSTFSARFTALVGEPPIRYLTRWRMLHATRLLVGGHEVGAVASHFGYGSEAAFRKAFSREIGTPPGKYRRAAQQGCASQLPPQQWSSNVGARSRSLT